MSDDFDKFVRHNVVSARFVGVFVLGGILETTDL